MSITWTVVLTVPQDAVPAVEPALAPFVEAVAAMEVPGDPDNWQIVGYAPAAPDHAALTAAVAVAAAAAGISAPDLRAFPLSPRDWIAESQRAQAPIRAGRFFVHGSDHRGSAPVGSVRICLEAGPAFGTGRHETTRACLLALDRLAREGWRPRRVLDLGCGAGLLAIAAAKSWPGTGGPHVLATDIDPIAVATTADNAQRNGVTGQVRCRVADGLRGLRPTATAGPFDLILANILAAPLVDMAADVTGALASGGTIVLSGMLREQAGRVAAAYRARRLVPGPATSMGAWTTLAFRKAATLR